MSRTVGEFVVVKLPISRTMHHSSGSFSCRILPSLLNRGSKESFLHPCCILPMLLGDGQQQAARHAVDSSGRTHSGGYLTEQPGAALPFHFPKDWFDFNVIPKAVAEVCPPLQSQEASLVQTTLKQCWWFCRDKCIGLCGLYVSRLGLRSVKMGLFASKLCQPNFSCVVGTESVQA
ncbi:unnamed protein product [Durusdinium trenchii]